MYYCNDNDYILMIKPVLSGNEAEFGSVLHSYLLIN